MYRDERLMANFVCTQMVLPDGRDTLNFARDVVEAAPARGARARRARARRLAPRVDLRRGRARRPRRWRPRSRASGVRRGDVVMTLVGNRPEWVFAMVACMRARLRRAPLQRAAARQGPRAAARGDAAGGDRLRRAQPRRARGGARPTAPCCSSRTRRAIDPGPAPDAPAARRSRRRRAGAGHLHERNGGRAEGRRPRCQRYLFGQTLQAEHWLGARAGELAWCTAASGWSKSARNVFVVPVAARRSGAAARRALRPGRAPRDRRARARRPALHGADRVPRHLPGAPSRGRCRRCGRSSPPARRSTPPTLEAFHARPGSGSATATARRRPARRRRSRTAREPVPGLDGAAAAGRSPLDRRRRAVPRPADRAVVLPRLPRRRGDARRRTDRGRRATAATAAPGGRATA